MMMRDDGDGVPGPFVVLLIGVTGAIAGPAAWGTTRTAVWPRQVLHRRYPAGDLPGEHNVERRPDLHQRTRCGAPRSEEPQR